MNLSEIATQVRSLAYEVGGNHHSNEETQEILLNLATEIDTNAFLIAEFAEHLYDFHGIKEESLKLYQRDRNIKWHDDPFADEYYKRGYEDGLNSKES